MMSFYKHYAYLCRCFHVWVGSSAVNTLEKGKCLHQKKEEHSMALNERKNLKLYYSISEVAQQFGLNESTLRYWETVFPQLHPQIVKSTRARQYTQEDISQISVIYNLVKERGFKLSAARKILTANRQGADRTSDVLQTLVSAREQLKDLKRQIDKLV